MLIPKPPAISDIDRISPTVYEAARLCVARASWTATGNRDEVPPQPRALLGLGAHAVFKLARRAGLPGATQEDRTRAAEATFEEHVSALFRKTHPLLRAKFETVEHIPYFHIYRARTALIAAALRGGQSRGAKAHADHVTPDDRRTQLESMLTSRDGRVAGRPDVVDADSATVVDYKTGRVEDPRRISEREQRLLRLYAHLAQENGIEIRRGVIERANRARATMDIAREDAEAEGRRARDTLDAYRRFANRPFGEAANPSRETCRHCPCIPFCPAFWEKANPEWESGYGPQIEGTVESLDGDSLLSLRVTVSRGTIPRGSAVVGRLSRNWLTMGEAEIPRTRDVVRVTDARRTGDGATPTMLQADRETTAVWRQTPEE
ncbi:MAG: PD-(D/E)XK nuclease family protein [Gammaproteobacteria bacterium]|nr:PD-(D/E)XK nuclease family protein [Gammaproteobacteria bacterium]